MTTNTAPADLTAIFAILSTDELLASIVYQEANEFRSERQEASLAAYRAELAAR